MPDRSAADIERLERDKAHAEAALKIAVDELHMAHCEQLRAAPWSRTLLAPTEAGLRDANAEYHPWDRVQMAGSRALQALKNIREGDDLDIVAKVATLAVIAAGSTGGLSSSGLNRRIEAMHRAGEAIQSLLNCLKLLARDRPDAGTPPGSPRLLKIAETLLAVRTRFGLDAAETEVPVASREIAAIMAAVARTSGDERGDVEGARLRLEQANTQVAAVAWSKIPARLRPR